jgi:multiple sugar transport system permease protein
LSPMHETRGFRWLRRIGLTLLTVLVLGPLYVMLSTSIKPLADVQQAFRWIPSRVTVAPYHDMWNTVSLAVYFRNSLIVSTVATVLAVTIALFAAYPLARLRFRGGRTFSIVVLSTQMFPGILFLLPLFLLYRQIQTVTGIELIGTYTGLIITYLTFSLPFSIWMLTGYLASLPRELEEAALVDGTGKVGALLRVVLPVARPGVLAVAVFAFMTAWGEVLFASVLTSDSTRTLAVGLQGYSQRQDVLWNQLMAAAVVVSLPVVLGFLAIQRFLVRGLSAGAVK